MTRKGFTLRAAMGACALTWGIGGAALTAVPTVSEAAAPVASHARHYMQTVQQTLAQRQQQHKGNDCALPVLVLVECVGVGVDMNYGGGPIDSGPISVYIVRWGWTSDPYNVAGYQENFFSALGGTPYLGSQTQYCDNTDTIVGIICQPGANYVANNAGLWNASRTWVDNTNAVPATIGDADIQAEADRAAAFFGNKTAASNQFAQYIIDTGHGANNNFGACAYHGSFTSPSGFGNVAYTNFPYMPDLGAGCGMDFLNPAPAGDVDGVSIVGIHEFSETATDVAPNSAWSTISGLALDGENGDKCAWIIAGPGAVTNITLTSGTYAVQSLWSNNANSGAGGCSTFYNSASDQH